MPLDRAASSLSGLGRYAPCAFGSTCDISLETAIDRINQWTLLFEVRTQTKETLSHIVVFRVEGDKFTHKHQHTQIRTQTHKHEYQHEDTHTYTRTRQHLHAHTFTHTLTHHVGCQPGTNLAYSNTGFSLLGRLLERVRCHACVVMVWVHSNGVRA